MKKYELELQQISNDICKIKDPVILENIRLRLLEIARSIENPISTSDDFDTIMQECIDLIKK